MNNTQIQTGDQPKFSQVDSAIANHNNHCINALDEPIGNNPGVIEITDQPIKPSLDTTLGQRTAQLNDLLLNQLHPLLVDILNEYDDCLLTPSVAKAIDDLIYEVDLQIASS